MFARFSYQKYVPHYFLQIYCRLCNKIKDSCPIGCTGESTGHFCSPEGCGYQEQGILPWNSTVIITNMKIFVSKIFVSKISRLQINILKFVVCFVFLYFLNPPNDKLIKKQWQKLYCIENESILQTCRYNFKSSWGTDPIHCHFSWISKASSLFTSSFYIISTPRPFVSSV